MQLDAILHSSSGQIAAHEIRDLRKRVGREVAGAMVYDKKLQLTEDEVIVCTDQLKKQGWLRENPNEVGAAAVQNASSRRAGKNLCLGERSYAELRGYVEEQNKSKCASCQQPCLLVSPQENL